MDGTAMDVLMEYVGWMSPAVAGRYVGVAASVAPSSGAKRSRDTAVTQADTLPLGRRTQRPTRQTVAESVRG